MKRADQLLQDQAALPSRTVARRLITGGKVYVGVSNQNVFCLDASNGVIHVIDSVLLPPEKTSAVHPRKMIESAIAQGAPMYNAGHAGDCAEVYMTTAKNILAMENHGMSSSTAHTLRTALTRSEHSSCSDTQAWTMRRALDVAYNNVR